MQLQTDGYSVHMDTTFQDILTQLRAEMAAARMSVREAADATGIAYVSLSRYMSGARDLPLGALMAILRELDVAPDQFFARVQARSAHREGK